MRALPCLWLVLAGMSALLAPAAADSGPVVAMVRSSRIAPFVTAGDALAGQLAATRPQPELLVFDLDGDAARGAAVMVDVLAAQPSVIVPVGSLATSVVLAAASPVPVVFSMVLYPAASGFLRTERAVTGVSLDIPEEQILARVAELMPGKRRIGIIHSAETADVVAAAARAASKMDFSVVAEKIHRPSEALDRLGALLPRVDVWWAIADTNVFSAETTEPMILESIRRRVPMIGLSAAQVRAGAIAAFATDPADIGRQTAGTVASILGGARAESIPVAKPRRVSLTVNARTAKWLSIDVSRAVASGAAEIIQ